MPQVRFAAKFAPEQYNQGTLYWLTSRYNQDRSVIEQALTDGRNFILGDKKLQLPIFHYLAIYILQTRPNSMYHYTAHADYSWASCLQEVDKWRESQCLANTYNYKSDMHGAPRRTCFRA